MTPDTPKQTEASFLVRLGTVIRNNREELELTQEDLAYRAGFDRTYVSLVERGRRNLSILNLQTFAVSLKLKLSELLREAEGGKHGSKS